MAAGGSAWDPGERRDGGRDGGGGAQMGKVSVDWTQSYSAEPPFSLHK